jgi:hypothetical protein
MAKPGLELADYKGQLKGIAAKSGWALCVGAGISRGPFPDWNALARSLMKLDPAADPALFRALRKDFNLDALIQASHDRLGHTSKAFAKILSDLLYGRIRKKLGVKRWSESALALTAGSTGQLSYAHWMRFKQTIEAVYPRVSSLAIADVVSQLITKDIPPAAIISFNAEPLLYALINAFVVQSAGPTARLKNVRPLDRVTQAISYRQAGHIPFFFCHGLLQVEGGFAKFNSSVAPANIVFAEGDYLQLANNAFSWQSSIFLGTTVLRSLLFVGLSFTDPNLRRWLAWVHASRNREREAKGKATTGTEHYWITQRPAKISKRRWLESLVEHLGVRIVWIDKWSDIGRCMKDLFSLS